jgi:uncharacterized protein (TIGR03382 family)
MTRAAALALAALAAAPASAQFRPSPMGVPSALDADVLPGRFTSATTPGELVTVDRATGDAELRLHGALLAPASFPAALPPGLAAYRAGRTQASAADAVSEVVYPAASGVGVQFVVPLQAVTFALFPRPPGVVSFAHLLAHGGDQLVCPSGSIGSGAGWFEAIDLETSTLGGTVAYTDWTANGLAPMDGVAHELFPVRLSAAALALGLDDLALPTNGGVLVAAHVPTARADLLYASAPLAIADLALAVLPVGGFSPLDRPPWLPASVARKGDALGAAAVDLDLDGLPDLLFSYGSAPGVADGQGGLVPNHLLLVRGTGDARDLATTAWEDVTGDPRLGLVDPVTLRPVEISGAPAAAVWDRALDELVVFWAEGGALHVWRGDAAGRRVRDVRVADVVGSPAPDLVVAAEDVLVYPDLANASPALAWAAGSPGPAVRGRDLTLAVEAGDADVGVALEWFVGDPYGAPIAAAAVPAGAAQARSYVHPGALLCGTPPQTLDVTVRATDALGVFAELAARLEVAYPAPALALSGVPGGALVLPPGGTSAVLDGASEAGCGPPAFTWGGTLFDAAPFVEEGTATTTRRTVDLPEAIYPALLAGPDPTVTLVAEDGAVASAPASLALALDASGLAEVVHSADLSALAPGEVAVLRTTVRSRLSVALPQAHVVDVLDGLAPAGPPAVTGAAAVATLRGGAEVVLDALPAGGAEVVIDLPVRAAGERGASAVEVRSSGGHLLSPGAGARAGGGALPGCGCGGAAGAEGLLALALLALRRRRRPT